MDEQENRNTNETPQKPNNWLKTFWMEYANEEKYPKKPTPTNIYVLGLIVGTIVSILTIICMYYIMKNLDTLYIVKTPLILVLFLMVLLVFFLSSYTVISGYQCIIRYGYSKTAKLFWFGIACIFLIWLTIGLLFSEEYYPLGFLLLGLLIGTIARAGKKQNPPT